MLFTCISLSFNSEMKITKLITKIKSKRRLSDRLGVVSSVPLEDHRESNLERWERARKVGQGQKKARGGEGRRSERDGKEETTDNPLLKSLRGRWQPQYSDWPFFAFCQLSHDMITSRVSRLLWRLAVWECFKIETTTIFSMLDLENLPQKKLGLLAVNKKLTDPLDVENQSRISFSFYAMFRVLPTGFGKSIG